MFGTILAKTFVTRRGNLEKRGPFICANSLVKIDDYERRVD